MSRRKKAVVRALFTYGQSFLGMALGLFVTRVVLHQLGRDLYGLWIASGALLAYAGLADLGVLGVLPWMIADADGRQDPARMKSLMSNSAVFASVSGVGFAAISGVLWLLYPAVLKLSASDQALLSGPIGVVVALTAVSFPLRVFGGLLTGLQDVTFLGASSLLQLVLTGGLTLVITLAGYGLYGLAIGTAFPPLLIAIVWFVRARISYGPLLSHWPRPSSALLRLLAVDGIGAWLAQLGLQIAAATDPVILSYIGLRESVSSFSITTRLALTLMQFGWILPDAGLVGLAQLAAEGPVGRVREIVIAVLRLNLLVSGAIASAVLASNATFVRIWVGSDFFLGARFNAVLAANVILLGIIHGLVTVASVLGKRLAVGVAFIANGAAHVSFALLLGHRIGVYGIVTATFVSGAATCLPAGLLLAKPIVDLSVRDLAGEVIAPWLVRFAPLGLIALTIGKVGERWPLPVLVMACASFGALYVWWMRPLYAGLPLGPTLTRWFRALNLLA
ncbi:MAG: lipopolysaccharide biosynthesis protein [Polyangiaceae bacterium]